MNEAKRAFKDGYRTNGGLLYNGDKLIYLPEADLIARQYGFLYAERMVKALRNVIACRICGEPTEMLGTRLYNRCWELEHRILSDPGIAVRVLREMGCKVECPEARKVERRWQYRGEDGGL